MGYWTTGLTNYQANGNGLGLELGLVVH